MGGIARAALAAALIGLLAGCMTPYQPAGMAGGYREQKLNEDTYLVSFNGNGNTPEGVVLKYFLYRCAELTVEKGYTYFELYAPAQDQSSNGSPFVKTAGRAPRTTYTYVPGGTITRWHARAIVRMYPKDLMMSAPTLFSAYEVIAALGAEVRSGNPSPTVPAKFRSVQGKFPIMPVRQEAVQSAPVVERPTGGPVDLDELKGLMPQK